MRRLGINLLAAAITLVGAVSLGSNSAEATVRGGCEDLRAAKQDFIYDCADSGGNSYACSSSCSIEGYSLSCTCYY